MGGRFLGGHQVGQGTCRPGWAVAGCGGRFKVVPRGGRFAMSAGDRNVGYPRRRVGPAATAGRTVGGAEQERMSGLVAVANGFGLAGPFWARPAAVCSTGILAGSGGVLTRPARPGLPGLSGPACPAFWPARPPGSARSARPARPGPPRPDLLGSTRRALPGPPGPARPARPARPAPARPACPVRLGLPARPACPGSPATPAGRESPKLRPLPSSAAPAWLPHHPRTGRTTRPTAPPGDTAPPPGAG